MVTAVCVDAGSRDNASHWPLIAVFLYFYEFDRKMTLPATSEFWKKSMPSGSLKTSLLTLANQLGYYGARISHERMKGLDCDTTFGSMINTIQSIYADTFRRFSVFLPPKPSFIFDILLSVNIYIPFDQSEDV